MKLDPNDRGEASNTTRLKTNTGDSATTRLKPNIVDATEDKGFLSQQEQLQNEAKLALAQVMYINAFTCEQRREKTFLWGF